MIIICFLIEFVTFFFHPVNSVYHFVNILPNVCSYHKLHYVKHLVCHFVNLYVLSFLYQMKCCLKVDVLQVHIGPSHVDQELGNLHMVVQGGLKFTKYLKNSKFSLIDKYTTFILLK